jgi:putative hydrolase of the HAD superfamily
MIPDIEAIFLDVGNTLRIVIEDPEFMAQAKKDLMVLIGAKESPEEFFEVLEKNWKAYRKQSKASLLEAGEKELWTKWLLPHYPPEKIGPLAGRLTRLWRDHDGRRVPREDAKDTIIELDRRGYKLGIIANTITETEIPDWMESDGVRDYFKEVILSSKVGLRKPNPEIYWLASRLIGVEPIKCAYLGDNPVRDVEGTRAAGYGTGDTPKPDFTIQSCRELLDIFPPRK